MQERAGRAHARDVAQDIAQRAAELVLKEIQAKGGHLSVSLDVAFGRHHKNARIKYLQAETRRAEREEPLVDDTTDAVDRVVRAHARLSDFAPARNEELDLAIFYKRLRKTMRGCSDFKESGAELHR